MTSWLSSAQHVRVDTGFGALPCAVSSDPVDGPAVFLVHGRNGAAVQPQMSALAEAYLRRGWAVVAPDLPFSVASPDLGAPEQATMAHHVAAATAVFDALLARRDGTAPLALCGHSLGAFAIARLARSRGGLHHLCAVSPVLSGQHLLAARAAMGGDALAVLEQEVPQMYASMAEESCALDLAATRTPVAVMTGTRDGITPPDHARAYFAACRNGRFFSVLPGLHHCPDGPGSGTRDGGGLGRRLHHERPRADGGMDCQTSRWCAAGLARRDIGHSSDP